MITHDLARRFCEAWNAASAGQTIHVHGSGKVDSIKHCDCWMSVTAGANRKPFASTDDAQRWLERQWSKAVGRLNSSR